MNLFIMIILHFTPFTTTFKSYFCAQIRVVKDPITFMVQPMGNEGDIGQIVEFVYVRKRRLGVKKLFGFCRYEKRVWVAKR